jgi:hypothetical protein
MNSADHIERAIAQLHLRTRTETDRRILDDASAALQAGVQKQPLDIGIAIGVCRTAWTVRVARPALVAAAILVGLALLFRALPGAEPTIGEIHKAFAKAENTCVSTFQAGKAEPFQQVWTSQTLNVKLFEVGAGNQTQFALWNMPIRVKMTRFLTSDSVQTEAITDQMLAGLDKSVAQSVRLFPFSEAADVPENAQWSSVDQSQVATRVPETRVYDLAWTAAGAAPEALAYRKCRLFVDIRTHLPRRAEWYAKSMPQDEYTFETFTVVSYPSESEIQDLIRNTFGPRPGRPDEPEYIGTPGTER